MKSNKTLTNHKKSGLIPLLVEFWHTKGVLVHKTTDANIRKK